MKSIVVIKFWYTICLTILIKWRNSCFWKLAPHWQRPWRWEGSFIFWNKSEKNFELRTYENVNHTFILHSSRVIDHHKFIRVRTPKIYNMLSNFIPTKKWHTEKEIAIVIQITLIIWFVAYRERNGIINTAWK